MDAVKKYRASLFCFCFWVDSVDAVKKYRTSFFCFWVDSVDGAEKYRALLFCFCFWVDSVYAVKKSIELHCSVSISGLTRWML